MSAHSDGAASTTTGCRLLNRLRNSNPEDPVSHSRPHRLERGIEGRLTRLEISETAGQRRNLTIGGRWSQLTISGPLVAPVLPERQNAPAKLRGPRPLDWTAYPAEPGPREALSSEPMNVRTRRFTDRVGRARPWSLSPSWRVAVGRVSARASALVVRRSIAHPQPPEVEAGSPWPGARSLGPSHPPANVPPRVHDAPLA